jgi:hypothetical protein
MTEWVHTAALEARDREASDFSYEMTDLFGKMLRDELAYSEKERISSIIEAMTNIDTRQKMAAFGDLLAVHPSAKLKSYLETLP